MITSESLAASRLGMALFLSGTVLLPRAHAQPAEDPARQRALDLFMEAETAYEAGEIEHAVELLQEARGLRQEPVLLYNLARAYETLGRTEQALEAYERFLIEEPDASDRRAIEARITALRQQLEERARLERRPASSTVIVSPPREASPAPWVTFGLGAAALGVAIGLGVASWQARQDAVDEPIHERADASVGRAQDFALAANVLYATGGAVALAGLIWGIVDVATSGGSAPPEGSRAHLRVGLGPGGVVLRGAW